MGAEVFWDTSGFFALLNTDDPAHGRAKALATAAAPAVTTEAVIGECCTLLIARRKPHLVARLLDFSERAGALEVLPCAGGRFEQTKEFLRRHLDHAYSFVDCTSFVVMADRHIREAATTDAHFVEAGFVALLR